MTSTSRSEYRYVGKFDGVQLRLPSGRFIEVDRRESIELLPSEAKAVKSLPGWEQVKAAKPSDTSQAEASTTFTQEN